MCFRSRKPTTTREVQESNSVVDEFGGEAGVQTRSGAQDFHDFFSEDLEDPQVP